MGEIEAVYQGVLTRTSYITGEEAAEENRKYHDVTEVVAQAIAIEMRPERAVRAAFEEQTWQSIKQEASPLGRLVMALPSKRRRFADLHDKVEVVAYRNPARAAIHPLLDTISDLAEESEVGQVSYAPDDLVKKCLGGNYTEYFVEDSGIDEEQIPRVLQVAARSLASIVFNLSMQRAMDPRYTGPPPYDYKAFEIFSRPERGAS